MYQYLLAVLDMEVLAWGIVAAVLGIVALAAVGIIGATSTVGYVLGLALFVFGGAVLWSGRVPWRPALAVMGLGLLLAVWNPTGIPAVETPLRLLIGGGS